MVNEVLRRRNPNTKIRLTCIAIGLVLMAAFASTAQECGVRIDVPQGAPVAIDGVLHADEWSDALELPLGEGASLHLKHADGSLLLALETPSSVAVNVLAAMDDCIRIMHSSAALGTAVYVQSDSAWSLRRDYVWRCRNRTMSAVAIAERELFLEEEGWLASITYLGMHNQVEYEILEAERISHIMLVTVSASGSASAAQWPIEAEQDVLPGMLQSTGHMDLSCWATVAIQDSENPASDDS